MIPGEVIAAPGDIELNAGRRTVSVPVANKGDRPIQVGATTTSVRPTPRSTSTARRPGASVSIFRLARRCASSRARRAPLRWSRSPVTGPSTVSASR